MLEKTLEISNKKAKIVVVGSINFDFSSYLTEFPKPAQTLLANSSIQALGGKGLNQAVASACAGADVSMIGCVGDDALGLKAIDYLNSHGINTSYVRKDPDNSTGTASIFVTKQGQNMIVVNANANACLSVVDIEQAEDIISQADAVLVQLEVPENTVKAALEMAKKHNVLTVMNPAPAADFAKGLLHLVDVITPNEVEVIDLVGIDPREPSCAEKAAKLFQEKGVNKVVITLGEYGSFISSEDFSTYIPAFDVEVIDTTGAGDVLSGVLTTKLANKLPLDMAVIQASVAAAISVTRPMAQGAAPTSEEIDEFIQSN